MEILCRDKTLGIIFWNHDNCVTKRHAILEKPALKIMLNITTTKKRLNWKGVLICHHHDNFSYKRKSSMLRNTFHSALLTGESGVCCCWQRVEAGVWLWLFMQPGSVWKLRNVYLGCGCCRAQWFSNRGQGTPRESFEEFHQVLSEVTYSLMSV